MDEETNKETSVDETEYMRPPESFRSTTEIRLDEMDKRLTQLETINKPSETPSDNT